MMQEFCGRFDLVAYLSYFVRHHIKLFLSSQPAFRTLSIITIPNNLIWFKNLDLIVWIWFMKDISIYFLILWTQAFCFYEFQSLGGITGRQYVFKLYFEKVISIFEKEAIFVYCKSFIWIFWTYWLNDTLRGRQCVHFAI